MQRVGVGLDAAVAALQREIEAVIEAHTATADLVKRAGVVALTAVSVIVVEIHALSATLG